MFQDILAAIPLGFLLSFMIGPVFFVLLETSVVKGFRAALVFDCGVVLADVIFILIAYFSSYRLIETIKDDPALFVFGGLVMLTYGIISFVKIRRASKKAQDIDPENPVELARTNYFNLFLKGFFLNFINIGVLGFWLALLITIGPKLELNAMRMLTFFTTVIIAYFVTDIFKILLAKQLRNKLNTKNINMIKKGISIVLIVSGIFLLSQGWFPQERQIMDKVYDKLEHQQ